MIPEHSAKQAITLAGQDWNLSAIARHLGHDRKTIRIYLNGSRAPGQPREQPHSFATFAGYAARRVRDDPHLRASGLHRELAELGYTGSYSALTRELRSNGISTLCVACQQKPHAAVSRAPIRRHQQSLPIRVAPIAGETLASYLKRLAAANHVPVSFVLAHLPPWFTARTVTHDDLAGAARVGAADVEHLATLTGLSTSTLLRALPAFGSGVRFRRSVPASITTDHSSAPPTPANGAPPDTDTPNRSPFTCQRTSGSASGTASGSATPTRSTSPRPPRPSTPTAGPPASPTATPRHASCSPN